MKIVSVIGARPQIIKAAALSRTIKTKFSRSIDEIIVHTGQHYDENMSQVFFDELGIPQPDYNLNVGSASHANQTAKMIVGLESILLDEKPDYLVLYGDTNSTLAGAITASKIHIPIVHIEAGLRSFNKTMPEEINRIMCDHSSALLFCPTKTAYNNLINEGFKPNQNMPVSSDNPAVFHCGDIMYDNSIYFRKLASSKISFLEGNKLEKAKFILATIHRDNNTDDPKRLMSIFKSLIKISEDNRIDIVLPIHPRTKKLLQKNLSENLYSQVMNHAKIKIIPPVSFLEMIVLEDNCTMVVTDSGGVQKEAYFFNKPCLILRSETEWKEIVDVGAAIVTDADDIRIVEAFNDLSTKEIQFPSIFGDANAAEFICQAMLDNL